MQSILRNNRLRRDARAMEDDEAMWFEQDEEMEEDDESLVPMTDAIKSKLDSDFDFQINKILENKKAKENDSKEENAGKFASNFCVQRGTSISITSPISISLKNTSPTAKEKEGEVKDDKDRSGKGLGSAFNLQHGGVLNSPVSIHLKNS